MRIRGIHPEPVEVWFKKWVPSVDDQERTLPVVLDILVDELLASISPNESGPKLTPVDPNPPTSENKAIQEFIRKIIRKPKDAHPLDGTESLMEAMRESVEIASSTLFQRYSMPIAFASILRGVPLRTI